MAIKPLFFASPAGFRSWLKKNHSREQELWVGFYKKGTGKPSLTWPESVDAALCFGWIDGIRKSVSADSYTIRFTPRRPGSTWSAINIRRVAELTKLELMHTAGLKAFAKRQDDKSAIYSYEQRKTASLDSAQEKQFRANQKAWEFFQSRPPGYRRLASWWVISAKKEETRLKRLRKLITDSAAGRTIVPMKRPGK